ncbi:PilZ domain-containing protein [Litorivicinus lipolyticus]|uniref:PilZ domain-containing protein n=1 Tax=Litorivicinus lipolyticus TaxID=418701 RepID=UPI003B5B8B99
MSRERRNYFRLKDRVAIEIKPLERARALDPTASLEDSSTRRFRLLSELEALSGETQSLLSAIAQREPQLVRCLRLMERKLNLIAEAAIDQDDEPLPDDEQDVSLSAGGVSFIARNLVAAGDYLAIRILLLPERAGLLLKSQVISVRERDSHFLVSCEFLNMDDADRAVITRHLMKSETRQRALAIT